MRLNPLARRRRPRLSRAQALEARPIRNPHLGSKRNERDELMLIVPRRNDWVGRLLSLIFIVPKERGIVLDAVGEDVWELCDGEHTVAQLVKQVGEKYKLNPREAEVSLTDYLRQLGKRNLIGLALPRSDSASGGTTDKEASGH
jgi:hypothetical protein